MLSQLACFAQQCLKYPSTGKHYPRNKILQLQCRRQTTKLCSAIEDHSTVDR